MNKTTKIIIINVSAITILFFLLWHPIKHIFNNHPYEYVYFNELSGGIDNAYGNYEMDYYYHSTRKASEWIKGEGINEQRNEAPFRGSGGKIIVATWHQASVNYFFRNDTADYHVKFVRWYERGNTDWDYAIFAITGIMPEEIKSENFPPKNTVHQIKVDGKPICLVLKRESKDDLLGNQLKNQRKYDSAILVLNNALQFDPTNISIAMNVVESYFNSQKLDSGKIVLDQLLAYAPKYEPANYMLAQYYQTFQQPDEALKILKSVRQNNIQFKSAYHLAFQIYAQKNDIKNAEKMMLDLLEIDQLDEQGFKQLIAVYKAQGLDERGAYKKIYAKYIKMYERNGMEKEAKNYRDALKKM